MKLQLPKILRIDSRRSPHLHKAAEKYKAAFEPQASSKPKRTTFYPGQVSWASRCKHYDDLTDKYSLAKVAPFTLAGLVTAQGVFFKPSETKPKKEEKAALDAEQKLTEQQKFGSYKIAEDAVYFIEKFAKEQQVNVKFYETVWRCAKYGGCFWEITDTPTFGFRIPTMQENIEPAEADEKGHITRWRQVVNGTVTAEWTEDELILIPFLGVTTQTWPFGSSLFAGTETELEMLTGVEESAKDYSEKQAWPYEVLQLGDKEQGFTVSDTEYYQARSEWQNRKPGQGLVTNLPTAILPGGTGSAPIRELAVICELMKDNVQDSVMIAPISKLYNSTEASAKVIVQHIMTVIGQPMQWVLAENFEEYITKQLLESSGYSRKSCPQTVFESPDVHKKEEGEYWTSLVNAQIQSPQQACEHLGLEYDDAYFTEKLKVEQEQFKQQLDAKKQETPKEEPKAVEKPQEAKEYDEYIVKRARRR